MRNLLMLTAVLFVVALPVKAQSQDYPSAEVFGGYSYLNTKFLDRDSLHGWGFSLAYNLGSQWGLVSEFSGHYGNASVPGTSAKVDLKKHTFLFGPRFSARSDGATGFAHVLLGGANSKIEGIDTGTGFALAVGGGVDVNVGKKFAIRIIQVDYLPERSFGSWTQNFRAQAGVVFKFGQ
ncbi:MAG TPA: outer membrane beta-barrel protein [Blastocatellia bacterium]|nr:outer membrane beta-barrel protein [Blastocatellia bacterium]